MICRIPFDPQYFIQGNCIDVSDAAEYQVRYKVYFIMEGVAVASHMEEQGDGTFKHIWTRASIGETTNGWNDKTKLDIVRPGRYNSYNS